MSYAIDDQGTTREPIIIANTTIIEDGPIPENFACPEKPSLRPNPLVPPACNSLMQTKTVAGLVHSFANQAGKTNDLVDNTVTAIPANYDYTNSYGFASGFVQEEPEKAPGEEDEGDASGMGVEDVTAATAATAGENPTMTENPTISEPATMSETPAKEEAEKNEQDFGMYYSNSQDLLYGTIHDEGLDKSSEEYLKRFYRVQDRIAMENMQQQELINASRRFTRLSFSHSLDCLSHTHSTVSLTFTRLSLSHSLDCLSHIHSILSIPSKILHSLR